MKKILALFFSLLSCISCNERVSTQFTKLTAGSTGIDFSNDLIENSDQFNIMQYPYFYNGGGVAVGDINNDGLPDIIFTGNMVKNRLYLNKGKFHFEDITAASGVADKQGWCTGVTMADINGDGWLDIYICRSGLRNPLFRKNLLFINNHDLTFTERAAEYGLDDAGYSTQASFFDYDKDGDLDLFVINQSQPQYAQGGQEYAQLRNKAADPAFENHLYRNDHGHFTNVTKTAGIQSNVLTFSLGLSTADIDQDGWPDVYVSNDFNEPDYLYINNRNGTFTEKLKEKIDHTSLYSMGCDVADFNNDGLPDICTLDMLPENNHDLKMHSGADNYDKFNYLFQLGFGYQYMKNSLQKNNGDGSFSEIGQLAGISNTDWSWSPLFADFDNDGKKDLFISNGYKRDNTNLQFVKYTMNESLRMQQGGAEVQVKDYVSNMQGIRIDNYLYQNQGDEHFINRIRDWGLQGPGFSNGAVYADLDNDGDLDLITNNIEEAAGIYRNNNEVLGKNNYLRLVLHGNKGNPGGYGAKIYGYGGGQIFYLEQLPVRGYQSSVDPVLHLGLGKIEKLDSLRIIWPDNHTGLLNNIKSNQTLQLDIRQAAAIHTYGNAQPKTLFTADHHLLEYRHQENEMNDFNRQILLPHFYSHNGPCLAKGDVNGDGLEDLYIGSTKGHAGVLYLQTASHQYLPSPQPEFLSDITGDAVDALFFDADGDGFPDLYVVHGGYGNYAENAAELQDALYINDGKGHFKLSQHSLPVNHGSKSCVRAADIDGDGDTDLFVGGKLIPGKWPLSSPSSIYINDGKGNFTDETNQWNPGLKTAGMVTDAVWTDLDKDGKKDLIIVGEWMQPTIYLNHQSKLEYAPVNQQLVDLKGWWNTITAGDFDGDGDIDFVLGNYGLNTQLRATDSTPVELYVSDINKDGFIDPVMTAYIQGVAYPFAAMDDINKQSPSLRKQFNEYPAYADAGIKEVLGTALQNMQPLRANTFETIYLENAGGGFRVKHLPVQAQYAPVYKIVASDVNADGWMDMILFGNNRYNRIRLGKDDADHGTVLLNDRKGGFYFLPSAMAGISVRGDVRSALFIGDNLFVGVNGDSLRVYKKNP